MRTYLLLPLASLAIMMMPATANALNPTAVATTTNVTVAGGTSYSFSVRYTDDGEINVSSLGNNDVRVTGPGGFNVAAAFVSVNVNTNGTPRIATYRIVPPGGNWNSADNGTYTVVMQANAVFDGLSNPVAAANIGSFTVMAPISTTPPTDLSPDINRDGVTDLVFQNTSTGHRATWLMNGTAYGSSASLPSAPRAWSIVGSADFNGDGKSDIVFQNESTRQVAVWYMNSISRTGSALLPSLLANWSVAATDDFNGDGRPDLVLENVANGQRSVWLMNGVSRTSTVFLPTTSVQWKIVGTGDFNGDGETDIVFQNTSMQRVAVWFMNGTTRASSAYLPTPAAQWTIAGIGDFNRDGKPDLILQNISTGQRALWLMNGVILTRGLFLPSTAVQWDIRNR